MRTIAEDLIFNIDYNITEAEAKQRKLEAQWKQSETRVEEFKSKISDTKSEIEGLKEKQALLNEELKKARDIAGKKALFLDNLKADVQSGKTTVKSGDMAALEKGAEAALNNVRQLEKSWESLNHKIREKEISEKRYNAELILEKSNLDVIGTKILGNTQKTKEQNGEVKKQGKSWKDITKHLKNNKSGLDRNLRRIKELIKSALFFSVLTKAFTSMRNALGDIFGQDKDISSRYEQLKNNLMVIATTVAQTIKPLVTWILDKVILITQAIQSVLSRALGKSTSEMQKMATNMNATAKNTKKAGQEAKKATASFDTLQTAVNSSSDSDDSSSAGSSVTPMKEFSPEMQEKIDKITAIVSAALLAIGVILLLSGAHVGLGLGLMILGAMGLAAVVAANWNSMSKEVKSVIAVLTTIISAAALTLGFILICTCANIPLGLGLLIVGAMGLAAVVKAMWNSLPESIQNTIQTILAIIGGALIVIGIILLFTVAGIPLGLGLILAGAASLATAVAADPENFLNKVKSFTNKIGNYFSNLWESIKNGFKSAFNWIVGTAKTIGNVFANLGTAIKNGIKSSLSWLIDKMSSVNKLVRKIGNWIKSPFSKDDSSYDAKISKTVNLKAPALATGAVLPGGSPTLAYVNDQPAGKTFLEGSVENILAAFEKYKPSSKETNPNYTIAATGQMAPLIRLLGLEIRKENERSTVF